MQLFFDFEDRRQDFVVDNSPAAISISIAFPYLGLMSTRFDFGFAILIFQDQDTHLYGRRQTFLGDAEVLSKMISLLCSLILFL